MPIPVSCSCGANIKAPDKLAGKTAKCPKCGEALEIPDPALEVQEEAPETKSPPKLARTRGKRGGTGVKARGARGRSSRKTADDSGGSRARRGKKDDANEQGGRRERGGRTSRQSRGGSKEGGNKKLMLIGIGALVLIGGGIAAYFLTQKETSSTGQGQTASAPAGGQTSTAMAGQSVAFGSPSTATPVAGTSVVTPIAANIPLPAAGSWEGTPGNGHKAGLQATNIDPTGTADVMIGIFGAKDRVWTVKDRKGRPKEKRTADNIEDMTALSDGSLIITGTIQGEDGIPPAGKTHRIGNGAVGENSAFVARLTPDGMKAEWFAVLPSETIDPQRIAVGPQGAIYLGGTIGKNEAGKVVAETQPGYKGAQGEFNKKSCKVVIMRIAADGSKLDWLIRGGPNQSKLTGMDVDPKGRVYWCGDPSGQGQATYVMRVDANGEQVPFTDYGKKGKNWCIYLHDTDEQMNQPDQIMSYYKKGHKQPYDYDGPKGWGKVKWGAFSFRHNGQVLCLPDGDIIVSASLFYRFKVGKERTFPAFDYYLARYSSEGRLKWSTNLYQEGDSVHTPDQKPRDMTYDPKTDTIYALVFQHGSNVYRFKGHLYGDTGNLGIHWVGKVDAKTGKLDKGWYFMSSYQGKYNDKGIPKSPPYPKLSGNGMEKIRVDGKGNVYVIGNAGAKMWTTPNAFKAWPKGQSGGGNPCLVVLDKDLNYQYATVISNGQTGDDVSGDANALAVTPQGVFVGGYFRGSGFPTGDSPAWANGSQTNAEAFLARFRW